MIARAALVVAAALLPLPACAGASPQAAAPVASASVEPAVGEAPAEPPPPGSLDRMLRFHSKRFDLSLPLPDGKAWRIDDHSHPELVATHAETRSRVVVYLSREDGLMDHATCEERARGLRLVPDALRPIDDHTGLALEQFDTRVLVGIEPPAAAGAPVVGHVLAFGGFLRKCIFFHYATEASADEEAELATRLALARTRIWEGIELDPLAGVVRDAPPPATK